MNPVEVSPDQARVWLRGSIQDRLNMQRIIKFAGYIENGAWDVKRMFNAPVIIRNNFVRDGHHRLMAILLANKSAVVNLRIDD